MKLLSKCVELFTGFPKFLFFLGRILLDICNFICVSVGFSKSVACTVRMLKKPCSLDTYITASASAIGIGLIVSLVCFFSCFSSSFSFFRVCGRL